MSDQNNSGKRQAPTPHAGSGGYWHRYRAWIARLSKGQRLRYRLLQVATVLSLFIVMGYAALSSWIQVPDIEQNLNDDVGDMSGDVSFDGAQVPDIARSGRKDGVYTFLVVGKDVASGSTDTMLLITYDTKEKTIYGLNLPRDTMVNVSTSSKRLNAVYSYNKGKDKTTQVKNGMAALKKQVAKLTGITPDFYVVVEWEAVGQLVDALGGVKFEVPFDMDYDDPYQDLHIHQKAGERVLNGDDAMQVIRFRKNNDRTIQMGDVGRLEIQQDFLKAVTKKCLQPATFLKIPELAKIFTENVTTDLSVGNILAFAQLAYGMNPDQDVTFATAPLAGSFMYRSASLVTLDADELLQVLNTNMNPYLRDIQKSDLELLVRKSNGSFGVTSGVLADERMGQVPTPAKPKPEPEQPETPPEDTTQGTPGQSGSGSTSQGGSSQNPDGSGSTGGDSTISPDSSLPPSDGSQPSTDTPDQSGGTQGGGAIIPPPIDPGQVLPDPAQPPSQDVGSGSGTVAVLPNRPQAVNPAA